MNKLRIGTHGRGIWQTDIPCNSEGTTLTISSNTTWNTPQHIYSNVHIEDGVVLTITSEVYMAEGKGIVVKAGGKLDIDGGSITNACGNLWFGIQVYGDPTSSSNPADQGWVLVQNGATIENSEQGIVASNLEIDPTKDDWIPNPAFAGGIIQATDSYFYNNQTAIQFYDYTAYSSVSWIRGCEFKVDDEYIGTTLPENYVVIDNMITVDVMYSDFINATSTNLQFTGILSENSTIYVWGQCNNSSDPCDDWDEVTFTNLEYGIYKLNGKAELFYREASIKRQITHSKNKPIQ